MLKTLRIFFCIGTMYSYTLLCQNLNTISDPNKFILITSLYNEVNQERIKEYLHCLRRNRKHTDISKIHVFYDSSKDDQNGNNILLNYLKSKPLIEITFIHGRPTFGFLFDFINAKYPHQKIILTNADIYFDETLHALLTYDLTGKFLSLTRWNVQKDGSLKPAFTNKVLERKYYGADTWIFKSPIAKLQDDTFALGTWGCDVRLIYQIHHSNLQLLNPSRHIKCCHMHISGIRNYDTNIELIRNKPMAWLQAGYLQDTTAVIHMFTKNSINFFNYIENY